MEKQIKHILLLFFILITSMSCEKDDICLEENTPRLIIRFYDAEEPEKFKSVKQLAIRVDGIDEFYLSEHVSIATDSIVIPIRVEHDITKIELVLNGADLDLDNDNPDFINLNYRREDKFISRSCGYKVLFYDVNTTLDDDNDNWIKNITTVETPQNITDENKSHLKIYH